MVQRRLIHQGTALRCGYVEAVAVREDWRGQGLAMAVLDAVEQVHAGRLPARCAQFLGRGPPHVRRARLAAVAGHDLGAGPGGLSRPPMTTQSFFVLPVLRRQSTPPAEITCDWRDGDVW